ncbi:hypothetical protein Tco_0258676 [Tanacetum coccineum]
MADFYHLDDAKDIWLAVKARFGGNEESKKMRKSMLNDMIRIFKKKSKKRAKDKQIQARSGKGKTKSHQNEENTT